MKTKILISLIGLFSLLNATAQTCKSYAFTPNSNNSNNNYCYYQKFIMCVTEQHPTISYAIFRRDSGTSSKKWTYVNDFTIKNTDSCLDKFGATFKEFFSANPPNSSLPNIKPLVFDLILIPFVATVDTNCNFSNAVRIRVNPIPLISVQPDTTKKNYCTNLIKTDTLKITASGVNNVIGNGLAYQWYRNSSQSTSSGNIVIPNVRTDTSICSRVSDSARYYFCKITNQFGCVATSNLSGHMNIYNTSTSNNHKTICSYELPYTWYGMTTPDTGVVFTSAGTKFANTGKINIYGCDSIAQLNLVVSIPPTKSTIISKCANTQPYVWSYNNIAYNRDTVITIRKPYGGTCDSLYILNLTVKAISRKNIDSTICFNKWVIVKGTKKYAATGTYIDTLVNKFDCDSIVTLRLTVLPNTVTKDTTLKICPNTSKVFNNKTYDRAGTSKDTIRNSAKCDSIIYNITVTDLFSTSSIKKDTICFGKTYTYDDTTYIGNVSGSFNYPKKHINKAGCDSTAYLQLRVLAAPTTLTQNINLCKGNKYTYNAKTYDSAGIYKDTVKSKRGCDSLFVTINLSYYTISSSVTNDTICLRDTPYIWNSRTYITNTIDSVKLNNAQGCDSTAILRLFIKSNSKDTTIYGSFCRGGSYTFNGDSYLKPGTFHISFGNAVGCDSIIHLILIYKTNVSSTTYATVCNTCNYIFNGHTYTLAGTFYENIRCDSTARLVLSKGIIGGSTLVCKSDTANYFIKHPQKNIRYNWFANNGTTYGNNPDTTIKVLWDSTVNTYVSVTATDSNNNVLFYDTLKISVGGLPTPKLATEGGVGCMLYKDSLFDNETHQWVYIIDTTTNGGCPNVCEYSSVKYYVKGNPNSTYKWHITNGDSIGAGASYIEVRWHSSNVGTGRITVEETTSFGCKNYVNYCFNILSIPVAHFYVNNIHTDTVYVCRRTGVQFYDSSYNLGTSIVHYNWNFGDGTTNATSNSPSHFYTNSGYYTTTLTLTNNCNCKSVFKRVIYVIDTTGINIVCASTECENGTATYSLDIGNNINGCSLDSGWHVKGGHITQYHGNYISVKWDDIDSSGFGEVSFDGNICPNLCRGVSIIRIPIIPTRHVVIKGDANICSQTITQYSLPFWTGTSYTWSVSNNATITYTPNPNIVNIVGNADSGVIDLHCFYFNSLAGSYGGCGDSVVLHIDMKPKASITGAESICIGDSVTYTSAGNSGNWLWQITKPDGSKDSISITDLVYTPKYTGEYTINIVGGNGCGSNNFKLTVFGKPLAPDTIQGTDSVCTNETYTYKLAHPQAGVTYNWYIKASTLTAASFVGLSTGKEVSIKYNSNAANFYTTIKVVATNENGCVSDTTYLPISRQVMRTGFVNADTVVCPDTRVVYEALYKEGESYEWSISPAGVGSISEGNGTARVIILWNHIYTGSTATIVLKIRKCGSLNSINKSIYIKPAPSLQLIAPTTAICRGSQFTASLQTSAGSSIGANILWSMGNGDSINTLGNSINYQYKTAIVNPTSYNLTATISNIQYQGCVYVDATTIGQTMRVNPTPEVITDKQGSYPTNGTTANEPINVIINPLYGQPDSLVWTMPSVKVGCIAPAYSCSHQTLTTVGSYFVTAKNNTGCQSNSNVVNVYTPVPLPTGCVFADSPYYIVDTIVHCGVLHYQAIWQKSNHSGSWFIGGYPFSKQDSGSYTLNKIGIYALNYSPVYEYFDSTSNKNISCFGDPFYKNIALPVLPKLEQKVSCKSNGKGYVLKATETSNKLDSTSNIVYSFYVDSVLQQSSSSARYADSSFALGSSHRLYVVVSYTYKGVAGSCYTAAQTFDIPAAVPDAGFSIAATPIGKHCEGLTLKLQPDSAFKPTNSYFWDFGDGSKNIIYNPEKNYVYDQNANPRQSSLQVSDGLGCTVVGTQTWNVVQSNLGGKIDEQGSNFVCPEGNFSIYYRLNQNTINPSTYVWFNSRNPILRQYSDSGIHNPYPIPQSGSYWVRVEDNNGCTKPIDGNAVVIFAPVEIPIITSNPAQAAGGDTLNVCINSKGFGLYAPPNLSGYTWKDSNGNVISTSDNYSCPKDSLVLGLHWFTVTTDNVIDNIGTTCPRTSKPFYVRVNPAPAQPQVSIAAIDCRSYTIGLAATSSTAGIFTWSNGDFNPQNATQSNTTVNQGGFYTVTLNTGLLCSSSQTIRVPNNPQDYFNDLPRGCYRVCLPANGFNITMPPSPPFAQWQWLLNGQAYIGGYNSPVPHQLQILNSGEYILSVNNGLCSDTAYNAILSVTQPDSCGVKEQNCGFNVTNTGINWSAAHDTAYLDFSITNTNAQPVAYTLAAAVAGGMVNGGVAQAGTHTYTIPFVMPAGGAGSCNFIFTFYYTLGNLPKNCSDTVVDVCLDDCLPRAAKAASIVRDNTIKSYLWIYPSVTSNITNISYKFAEQASANTEQGARNDTYSNNAQKQLLIYNDKGLRVAAYTVQEKGILQLSVGQLPKGLYLVQLAANNRVEQTGKLIVIR